MKLLERLQQPGLATTPLVLPNGSLAKCMDDFVHGFQVGFAGPLYRNLTAH